MVAVVITSMLIAAICVVVDISLLRCPLARLHIPIFVPILGGQEPGAGFLFLLGFLRNPKGTFLMFLLFLRVGTLVPLRNRNVFLLP